ncbi:MAG: hypothetical protein V2A73_21235, partial [Pseudomonadota bacterium]
VAFVMGMPFPMAFRRLGRESRALPSWVWALNGGASVLASVMAVIVSMSMGFTACLAAATAVYFVALLFGIALLRHPATAQQASGIP